MKELGGVNGLLTLLTYPPDGARTELYVCMEVEGRGIKEGGADAQINAIGSNWMVFAAWEMIR